MNEYIYFETFSTVFFSRNKLSGESLAHLLAFYFGSFETNESCFEFVKWFIFSGSRC